MKNMTGSLFLYFIPNKSLYLPAVYNKSTYNGNERICNFRSAGRDCGAGGTHYEDAGRAEDE